MGCGQLGAEGASSKQCECKPVLATWPQRQQLMCACILFHQHSIFWNRGLQHPAWSARSCLCWSLSEADTDMSEASIETFCICLLLGVTAWPLILKTVLLLSKQKQGTFLSYKKLLMMPPFCTGDIKTFKQDMRHLGPAHSFWVVRIYPDYFAVDYVWEYSG